MAQPGSIVRNPQSPGPGHQETPGRLNFAFVANRVRDHGGATLATYLLLFPRKRW